MTAKEIVSPKMSFKGWNLKELFLGNWKTIKELLKVGIPALVGLAATHHPALVGLITIFGKALLDTGEYYFTEYTK